MNCLTQHKQEHGVPFTAQCRVANLPYSTFQRWQTRVRQARAPVCRPGPAPVGTPDWGRLLPDLLALDHGRQRTRGTGALWRQYQDQISRRDLQAWVAYVRDAVRDEAEANTLHIEWLTPGLVWAMDAVDIIGHIEGGKQQFQTIQDLASRFKFEPLGARNLCGDEIAGALHGLFRQHDPPLFLKRDNGGNQNHPAIDDILAQFWVIPVNSPLAYPQYNGGVEHAQGEIQQQVARRNEYRPAIPVAHLEAYTAAATADLNHRPRPCLGGQTACAVFTSSRGQGMVDRRQRKGVTDELIVLAGEFLDSCSARGNQQERAAKAWRLAVFSWLLAHRAIAVSYNRVSPTSYAQTIS